MVECTIPKVSGVLISALKSAGVVPCVVQILLKVIALPLRAITSAVTMGVPYHPCLGHGYVPAIIWAASSRLWQHLRLLFQLGSRVLLPSPFLEQALFFAQGCTVGQGNKANF